MDWNDLISKAAIAIITGLVAAFFSARYALGRYYKEKWWDKRLDLYLQLVECIHLLKKCADYWNGRAQSNKSEYPTGFEIKSQEEEKKLSEIFHTELENLRRIGDLSPLLLNEKCEQLITDFFENEENLSQAWEYDAIEFADATKSRYEILKSMLNDIITEAKKELKTNNGKLNIKINIYKTNKDNNEDDDINYYA